MRHRALSVATYLACIGVAACNQDSVQPPFVDPYAITTLAGQSASEGAAGRGGPPSSGASGVGTIVTAGTGVTVTAGTGMTVAAGTGATVTAGTGTSVTGGTGATVTAGTGMTVTAGTMAGSMAGTAGMAAGGAGMPTPVDSQCDLSGRWMSTLHLVTEAIGQQQTAHSWVYYEIARQGGGYAVTKGMMCGTNAEALGGFAVQVDFEPSWPVERTKVSFVGRTVTSTKGANGCQVQFGRWYTVRGATTEFYRDPKNSVPSAAQQAMGSTPGWEDWDNDGKPGITGFLSGTVTGRIFVAPRQWTELSGTVPNTMSKFKLPAQWDQEQNVMAYDPPDNFLLASTSDPAPDPALHFGEFARLSDDQATGDDQAICDAVIALSPTLTPAADAI